jgi:hypothetical protein
MDAGRQSAPIDYLVNVAALRRSRPGWRLSLVSGCSACGLALAAIVNVATYFGRSFAPHTPFVLAMDVGIVPLFWIAQARLNRWRGEWSGWRRIGPPHWTELKLFFPGWVFAAVLLLFTYAMVNIFLSTGLPPAHAQSPASTDALLALRVRSAQWLFLYSIPALYLGIVPADAFPRGE